MIVSWHTFCINTIYYNNNDISPLCFDAVYTGYACAISGLYGPYPTSPRFAWRLSGILKRQRILGLCDHMSLGDISDTLKAKQKKQTNRRNNDLLSSTLEFMYSNICMYMWAGPWENVFYDIYEQQRRRSACTSAQSDQRLYCSLLR